jgi:hypothetical protein
MQNAAGGAIGREGPASRRGQKQQVLASFLRVSRRLAAFGVQFAAKVFIGRTLHM